MRPIVRRCQIMTDPILCGPDITGLQTYLQLLYMPNGAGGTAELKVHRVGMGIVPDPRAAFGQAT